MAKNPTSIPANAVRNMLPDRNHMIPTAMVRKPDESMMAKRPCLIDRRRPLPAMTAIRNGEKPITPMSIPTTKASGSSKIAIGNARPFRLRHVGSLQYIVRQRACPLQNEERTPIMNICP